MESSVEKSRQGSAQAVRVRNVSGDFGQLVSGKKIGCFGRCVWEGETGFREERIMFWRRKGRGDFLREDIKYDQFPPSRIRKEANGRKKRKTDGVD